MEEQMNMKNKFNAEKQITVLELSENSLEILLDHFQTVRQTGYALRISEKYILDPYERTTLVVDMETTDEYLEEVQNLEDIYYVVEEKSITFPDAGDDIKGIEILVIKAKRYNHELAKECSFIYMKTCTDELIGLQEIFCGEFGKTKLIPYYNMTNQSVAVLIEEQCVFNN